MRFRIRFAAVATALALASLLHVVVGAQSSSVGRNINVITGSSDQFIGDMYRQRQNEPVLGISSINPSHMIAAYNDYRTVDIQDDAGVGTTSPAQSAIARLLNFVMPWRRVERKAVPAEADAAQAWIGLSFSDNGGKNWYTGLHPGFRLLTNPIPATADPTWDQAQLLQFEAASDPVMAMTHDQFFVGGIAFNPGGNSVGFVSRFTDRNNSQAGQNIQYDGSKVLLSQPADFFVDKPNIAAGPNGHVYAAFVLFDQQDPKKLSSKIVFYRSSNFGASWQGPVTLSDPLTKNQSPWILVDPNNENIVYVGWRVFSNNSGGIANAVVGRKSINGGATFFPGTPYTVAAQLKAFDQPQVQLSQQTLPIPRSNAYPTAAIDGTGALHVAMQEYVNPKDGIPLGNGNIKNGVPRITVTSSYDGGVTWTARKAVDFGPGSGTQFMPVLTAVGEPGTSCSQNGGPRSRVLLMYYDARSGNVGKATGTDGYVTGGGTQFDVRIAQASACNRDASGRLAFSPSEQASRYTRSAVAPHDIVTTPGYGYAAVNRGLEMFCGGRCSFTGDYIGLTPRVPYVLTASGWRLTTAIAVDKAKLPSPIVQGVWADMRDAIFPTIPGPALPPGPTFVDGLAWWNYQPPGTGQVPNACQNPGARDQNVYTMEYAPGQLFAAAPETFQPSAAAPRSYPVYVENRAGEQRFFRLTIDATAFASFDYHSFDSTNPTPLLRTADVAIGAYSTVTGSVIIGPGANTAIRIGVAQLAPPGQNGVSPGLLANGAQTSVTLAVGSIETVPTTLEQAPTIDQTPTITKPFGAVPAGGIQMTPFTQTPFTQTTFEANPFTQTPFTQTTTVYDVTDYTFRVTNAGDAAAAFAALLAIGKNLNNSYLFQVMVNRIGQRGAIVGCNSVDQAYENQISNLFVSVVNPFTQTPFTQTPFTQTPFTQTPFTQTPFTQTPFTQTPFTQTADPRDPTITNATFYMAPAGSSSPGYVGSRPTDVVTYTLRAYQVKPFTDAGFVPLEADPANPTGGAIGVTVVPEIPNVTIVDGVPVFDPPGTPTASGGTRLRFVVQPTATAAGAAIAPPVQVAIQDGSGATLTNLTLSVTLAIGTNPAAGTLSGTLVRTTVGGVATFDDLSIDKVGIGYTLVASAGAFAAVASDPFAVLGTVVTNTSDAGPGSLRQAITTANATPPAAPAPLIAFNIPGNGVRTITPLSALPAITRSMIIDATTQPGYGGAPLIELNGSQAGTTSGLVLTGGSSTIRGLAVNRFVGEGIFVSGPGTSSNTIRDNYIGTNPAGTLALANTNSGVYLRRSGGNSVLNNLISGNAGFAGLAICATPSFCGGGADTGTSAQGADNIVRGNRIGTTAAGTAALPNNGYGVSIDGAPGTQVGGKVGDGNLISGNGLSGVEIFGGPGADGNAIIGNTIAANGGDGVTIVGTAIGNSIHANSIHDNGGLGIDLADDGVTANDAGDADSGPNGLQNFPIITAATPTAVAATLNSVPNQSFRVAVYKSTSCDASGYGEGATFVGSVVVATDDSGNAGFTLPNLSLQVGEQITATATVDVATQANTSEFSACAAVTAVAPANQLVFTGQPASTLPGVAIAPPVVVEARDGFGNPATGAGGSITLALGTNTGGEFAFLSGTTTKSLVNGVATFTDLTINLAGTVYTLVASYPGVLSATSRAFSVTIPTPILAFTGTEADTVDGVPVTRYTLSVTNRSSFPDEMFAPAPDLPPCGLNTNASRTWVDIYGPSNQAVYGFCNLTDSAGLDQIWFAVPADTTPPSPVYITLTDRRTGFVYTSNPVSVTTPTPIAAFKGTEPFTVDGVDVMRYRLTVTNRALYPDELFAPAPELPPCGATPNASRTWVDIYGPDDTYIYGFCGLGSAAELDDIWFGLGVGATPPSPVHITLTDRLTNQVYTSNAVSVQPLVTFDAPVFNGVRQAINPYADQALTFTAQSPFFDGAVVGIVRNQQEATTACVPPESTSQLLGSGSTVDNIGLATAAMTVAMPQIGMAAPVTVSVDVQSVSDAVVRLRLYDASDNLLATATAAPPAIGKCPGATGADRGSVNVSATLATGTVAYAIVDEASGIRAFVIDNFRVKVP